MTDESVSKQDETQNPEIESLIGLARQKSQAGRNSIFETVQDLFLQKKDGLSERERTLMSDILRQLIHQVEISVRKDVATRLAKRNDAPKELVLVLANDEIEVAHSLLVNSMVLHDADQDAGGQGQFAGSGHLGHQVEAERQQADAGGDHPARAVFVGDRSGDRLGQPPEQTLDGHREGEDLAAPAEKGADRLQEESEPRPRAERHHHDDRAEHQDHHGSAPGHGSLVLYQRALSETP